MGNGSSSGRGWSRSRAAFKCVVIGETGSGKTSFLNLIGNLGSVMKLGADVELTKDVVRHLHREAQTEAANASQSKSQTKKAHAHRVRGLDFDLTIIDTPGFGDTEGLEEDKKHVANIVSAVEKQDAVNCIVLVMNGRVARESAQLRYVLASVCAIIPEQILKQVIVVFTQVKDPDDDLLYDPAGLEKYFGKLSGDRLMYIDNPYAKVAKLIERGSRDEQKKLRLIKADFDTVTKDLEELFQKIYSFEPVETKVFTELYDTKQTIDKVAMQLNQELENILAKRARAEEMKTALQDVTKSKEAYSQFETSREVEEWTFEETPGLHHMVCSECKNTCHHSCKIERAFDKVMVFKNCQCFQVKTRKAIKVDNEGHWSALLNAASDIKTHFVDTEEDRATSGDMTRAAIRVNATINGTLVRGDPETMWINNRFGTYALCEDEGTTRDTLKRKRLPFTVAFSDWSGVERGAGMPCTSCGHSLSVHAHQTCQYRKVRKTETHVDAHMKAKFAQLTSDEEKQKLALDALNGTLRDLEEKEKDLKKRLKDNLANFGRIAVSSSYVSLLEEQKTYLEVLKRNASQAGKTQTVKALDEQLAVIETLKATIKKR